MQAMVSEPARFGGRTILVTGGAVGIGRAVAALVAREGGLPVICGRDQDRLDRVRQDFLAGRLPVCCIRADMSVQADVDAFIQTAISATGRIDGLVCAAGT